MKSSRKKPAKRTARRRSGAKGLPARSAGAASGKSKRPRSGDAAGKRSARGTKRIAKPRRAKKPALALAPGLGKLIGGSRAHAKACRRLADNVMFTVAPKTMSGEPIQGQRDLAKDIERYRPRPLAEDLAAKHLAQLGFRIVHRGEFGITVCGPAELVADVLKIDLVIQARPRRTRLRATQNFAVSYETPASDDLYVAPTESLSVKSTIDDYTDHFIFIPPPHFSAPPSPTAPDEGYYKIDKAAIQRLLNVPGGSTGAGVNVGMVDTGFFDHPYYAANGLDYRPTPTSTVPDPRSDPEGHGTAMAFNTFAVATGVTLMGFKRLQQAPHTAMEEAAAAGVDIITCSWGWRDEQRFNIVEATITSLVNKGKIVLFSSGDGQAFWPASMPQVLAVGGVYCNPKNELEASNYASGFVSDYPDYNNRRVPDVCGLCGQSPMGIYIMLPCPPNCTIDQDYAGMSFPNRDQTAADDGWVCASGTSSATAQVAGVAALVVAHARTLGRPALTTDAVKTLLQQTAVPVQKGKNAQGVPPVGHPNTAVGFGLVDVDAALKAV